MKFISLHTKLVPSSFDSDHFGILLYSGCHGFVKYSRWRNIVVYFRKLNHENNAFVLPFFGRFFSLLLSYFFNLNELLLRDLNQGFKKNTEILDHFLKMSFLFDHERVSHQENFLPRILVILFHKIFFPRLREKSTQKVKHLNYLFFYW